METLAKPLSRRRFAQLLGLGAATTVLRPSLAPAAPVRRLAGPLAGHATDIVRLSSNENPYGPSAAAFDAMRAAFESAWRYPDEAVDALAAEIAAHHRVEPRNVLLGDGSSEILKVCAAALTGPGRPAVAASPTFEALSRYARAGGAETASVPLTPEYQHDLPKMQAAAAGTGLLYVCNPNNPTGTITPKDRLHPFLTALPSGVTALVDEAYFHYAEEDHPDYASVIPLTREHPNVVVARTFSKIYGMAGLRCGYAVAHADTIERLRAQQAWDSLNVMAIAAARASLGDHQHVMHSRRLNREAKTYVATEVERLGFHFIPSATNFLMADLRRPVGPVIEALKQRKVEVGRVFPALPTHLRVTIGTKEQMRRFAGALREILA